MTALNPPPPNAPLILASSSRYRAELLARLRLSFEAISAAVNETPQAGEAPQVLAERLAEAKAAALAARHPDRWILGSDQVCACGDRPLGKPGSRDATIAQLVAQSGHRIEFFTATTLMRASSNSRYAHTDVTVVQFRRLDAAEIERYVDAEPAFDCAGGFKCEGLGISLFESIESRDPTALIGLPLIAVRRLLRQAGYAIP